MATEIDATNQDGLPIKAWKTTDRVYATKGLAEAAELKDIHRSLGEIRRLIFSQMVREARKVDAPD